MGWLASGTRTSDVPLCTQHLPTAVTCRAAAHRIFKTNPHFIEDNTEMQNKGARWVGLCPRVCGGISRRQ